MNCESGSHRYRPFKRSRDLFCTECGDVRPFIPRNSGNRSDPALQVGGSAEHALPQSAPHEERDPYVDDARDIIENADFVKQVNAALDANGVVGPLRDMLYAEAMNFGPTLDLKMWYDRVAEYVERIDVAEPLEDLIDGLITE